jgi:carnitine O-acetyltransferase
VLDAKVERAAVHVDEGGRPDLDILPKKLIFSVSPSIVKRICHAEASLCDEMGANDTFVLEFRDYGKQLLVKNKLSPDSVVQMTLAMAYFKLYGKVVCQYEPVLTKQFYHGRTEAMRSTTLQAKKLCEVWCDPNSTATAKLEVLRVATKEHSRLVTECAGGKGVDRHMFALKSIADTIGEPTPSFFQCDAWKSLNHTVISTSNCGNPSLRLFGFGPVVSDGLGCGYIIKDHGISYALTSKSRQTQRYARTLETVLKEIQSVLQPLSNVQVINRAPPPSSRPQAATYDDFYGESARGHPESRRLLSLTSNDSLASMGRYYSTVSRQPSVNLRDAPYITLNLAEDTGA